MSFFAIVAGTGTDQASTRHPTKASAADDSSVHRTVKHLAGVILGAALLLLVACSDGNDNGTRSSAVSQDFAVGTTSMTFIDTSRPTAAHGSVPEASSRTIETTIVYPAEGTPGGAVTADAPADRWGAPFPLMVLSHGLGGSVEGLLPLAEVWASRGYVVALPRFPLTSNATPGGPAGEDVQNQPADVSFVIDEVLAASSTLGQLLSNAVDGDKIAASGHSNGGITTYGLVAHSCCRDPRVDAAIVLSGVAVPFAGGEYDLSDTPSILLVHGVNDAQLIYNQAVRTYNQLQPPKGLLTLEESDHGSYFHPDNPAFNVFAQATADFLDGELRGDSTALERLPGYLIPDVATMHWAPDAASNVPVETLPEPETNRQAFLSSDSNLVDGQVITVTWSGFLVLPEKVVSILQCAGDGRDQASCRIDFSEGTILVPDPDGMDSLELVIHTGPIGSGTGVCDSANPCTVVVNDASLIDDEANVRIPITLAD
jgi:predicted esterase